MKQRSVDTPTVKHQEYNHYRSDITAGKGRAAILYSFVTLMLFSQLVVDAII